MTFDARRERLRKEKGAHDVVVQCTYKYEKECKYNGSRHLTQTEVNGYLNAYDKDEYLKSIGKFGMEAC